MSINNGIYMAASDAANYLKEQNKTSEGYKVWRQLYGDIDLAKQTAMSNLQYNTEKNIGEAYAAAFSAKQSVANSDYFDVYKEQLDIGIEDTLSKAYESYLQNYREGATKIAEESKTAISDVMSALKYNAESQAALYNSVPEYLEALYAETYNQDFWKDPNWSKYLATDKRGRQYLMDWATLSAGEKNEETGEYIRNPFFTEPDKAGNRSLTTAGMDFYDQMLNEMANTGVSMSYDDWLAESNPELYEYYSSVNPYSYSPKNASGVTTGGSIFRELVGLKSTDQQYQFAERFGGFTKTQLDTTISKISDKLSAAIKRGDTKKAVNDMSSVIDEVQALTKHLGIDEEFEQQLAESGVTTEALKNMLAAYSKGTISTADMAGDWFANFGKSTLQTGVVGVGTGTTIGGAIGIPTGPGAAVTAGGGAIIGGLAGLAVGAIGGAITSTINAIDQGKSNKQIKDVSKKYVTKLVADLTAYAENARQQSQK